MSANSRPGLSDLRSRVLGGLVWVGASQAGLQITRVIAAIAIARLLTPKEYGLAALALVFASLVLVFSDLALGAALIQRKTLSALDRDTAFWVTAASGVLFTILGVALAGPLAALYGEPSAKPLLVALSASFLVSALGAPQQSLMLRDMDFKRVEILPMFGALAGGAAGVAIAVAGGGAWAIITQYLAAAFVTTLLVWLRSTWRPRFAFSWASLRDLGGFSIYMLGHRMLYYLQTNGDRFLVGRFLGAGPLGAYALAFNTIVQPASKLGGPLQRVMSPAFCRIQEEPERIAAAWARVTRMLAALAVPALVGLAVVAPDFVRVVLGDQWIAAVPVVQILAWVGIIQALQSLSVDVLMARGRARTIFRFSLLLSTCHLIAFALGLQWGVTGVAVAFALSTTLIEPFQTVLAARALGVSPDDHRSQHRRGVPGGLRDGRGRPGRAHRPGRRRDTRGRAPVDLHGSRSARLRAAVRLARARSCAGGARPAAARGRAGAGHPGARRGRQRLRRAPHHPRGWVASVTHAGEGRAALAVVAPAGPHPVANSTRSSTVLGNHTPRRTRRAALLTIAALAGLLATGPAALGATRLVAPGGSAAGDCRGAPCASFAHAYGLSARGDVVQVAPGAYGPQTIPSGSKAVTFRGAGAAKVSELDNSADNVTFDGIDVDVNFAQNAGFENHGAANVTFKNGRIGNVTDEKGAVITGPNFTFDNVVFHDVRATGSSVHNECVFALDVDGMTVRNSLFHECATMDLFFTYGHWWNPKPPAYGNITLENNVFGHSTMPEAGLVALLQPLHRRHRRRRWLGLWLDRSQQHVRDRREHRDGRIERHALGRQRRRLDLPRRHRLQVQRRQEVLRHRQGRQSGFEHQGDPGAVRLGQPRRPGLQAQAGLARHRRRRPRGPSGAGPRRPAPRRPPRRRRARVRRRPARRRAAYHSDAPRLGFRSALAYQPPGDLQAAPGLLQGRTAAPVGVRAHAARRSHPALAQGPQAAHGAHDEAEGAQARHAANPCGRPAQRSLPGVGCHFERRQADRARCAQAARSLKGVVPSPLSTARRSARRSSAVLRPTEGAIPASAIGAVSAPGNACSSSTNVTAPASARRRARTS